ncbi:hypothetical protein KSZ_02850 [Dictyobacter formicarum]|uniref:Uncharacterized protein n=1 Tax=Dictyobacter formicarum TaxID=2778368 RepID=A0ABQ3V8W7_9CHLR|nr:hypothetical protein KSZ_02850 [Dictyobacter formicarum]
MKMYTLIGIDGKPYQSEQKGTFGGYKPDRIYGRFDCPSENNAIVKGQYSSIASFSPTSSRPSRQAIGPVPGA